MIPFQLIEEDICCTIYPEEVLRDDKERSLLETREEILSCFLRKIKVSDSPSLRGILEHLRKAPCSSMPVIEEKVMKKYLKEARSSPYFKETLLPTDPEQLSSLYKEENGLQEILQKLPNDHLASYLAYLKKKPEFIKLVKDKPENAASLCKVFRLSFHSNIAPRPSIIEDFTLDPTVLISLILHSTPKYTLLAKPTILGLIMLCASLNSEDVIKVFNFLDSHIVRDHEDFFLPTINNIWKGFDENKRSEILPFLTPLLSETMKKGILVDSYDLETGITITSSGGER